MEIDGSFGEGGGQILRSSMTLSAITGKSIKIKNIRAKRDKPGLQPQHLMACLAVREVCGGDLAGGYIGSTELHFNPNSIKAGAYTFDIKTAGTTTLVAQAILPVLINATEPSLIEIIGGTHLPHAPSFDYLSHVFMPAIKRMGVIAHVSMEKSGYYPAGGGKIILEIEPSLPKGCSDWSIADHRQAMIRLSKLPRHIGEREEKVLKDKGISHVEILEESAFSQANSLLAWQGFRGSSALGVRGKPAELVAEELIQELEEEKGEVDKYLADQLLLYAALAKGPTSYQTSTITEHLRTNAYVIKHFLSKEIQITSEGHVKVE